MLLVTHPPRLRPEALYWASMRAVAVELACPKAVAEREARAVTKAAVRILLSGKRVPTGMWGRMRLAEEAERLLSCEVSVEGATATEDGLSAELRSAWERSETELSWGGVSQF